MIKTSIKLVLLLQAAHVWAGEDVLSVGTDQNCDFNDIQSAINSGNELSIHITNQQIYREHLVIDGLDISIRGGYSNCDQAENGSPGNSKTVISGDLNDDDVGDGSVLSITGTGFVFLENMKITEGNGGEKSGGISINDFSGHTTLYNMIINENASFKGGGVGLHDSPGAKLNIGSDVLIIQNRANFSGGGLYCNDESIIRTTYQATNSGISYNTVAIAGGGVFLGDGCEMTFSAGRIDQGFFDFRGIAGNQAGMHGGGAFISNGAKLYLSPKAGHAMNLSENVADANDSGHGHGGGAYLTGEFSLLEATNSYIAANQAVDGGGVYVRNEAQFKSISNAQGCVNSKRCAYIKSNTASAKGGAIYADFNAEVTLLRTAVEYNRADFGTAIYNDEGANSQVDFSIFSRNGANGAGGWLDQAVFQVHGGANMAMVQSTVVDNYAETAVFATGMTAFDLDLINSIIHDPSSGLAVDLAESQEDSLFVWCAMLHEDASGLYGDNIIVDDPHFIDRMARDFSLNHQSSTAVDECFEWSNHSTDYIGAAAGWDDPNVIVSGGGYDMGAFEAYGSDIIFKHGMED